MATLLYVSSSIFGDNGNSSQLANDFIQRWQADNGGTVIRRDVGTEALPHLSAAHTGAFFTPAEQRSAEQNDIVARSDALIDEVRQADVIVLAVPMYNFGVPTQLKAWLDQLARAGVTFRYTENGPVGLIDNKPVIIFAARGGLYAHTGNDHQAPFLKQFLGFIGLTDVTFIYAEGVNMGDDAKQKALDTARQQSAQLLEKIADAA